MAGRIRDEDIAEVRERARIEEIVRDYVTLKSAGGGSLKGLCPFHDEKSPSFNVNAGRGYFHCFGCQEGGDVFAFVMKIDHLGFTEAVEKLAARTGVDLRYVEGGTAAGRDRGLRARLIEAHKAAAEFYTENLTTDAARIGRDFLTERGFDRDAAAMFSVGFAPPGWDGLTKHLRGRGFSDEEMLKGGLVAQKDRDKGVYDRFRGRLVWPIRDLSGDVVGFGARRLAEDDQGPKYLNTPETPIYKKSQVLYGLDIAKREIARQQRAVVVEGYTDVMACHLSGVDTAVATCGTAFGIDHIKVLRRLLMDQNEMRGEVVFCFDGDAAGQKAALKAFEDDQRFVTQTFVAVEPNGLDPCDLRLQEGPDAVRDLVARRVPLFEFAIRSRLQGYDLDTAEGRINGLRAAAPAVVSIKDHSLRPEYVRLVAGWLGMEIGPVRDEVTRVERQMRTRSSTPQERPAGAVVSDASPNRLEGPTMPPPGYPDPAVQVEREALKVALQWPVLVGPVFDAVAVSAFTVPAFAEIREAIEKAGGVGSSPVGDAWIAAVRDVAPDDRVRAHTTALAVEPLRVDGEGDEQRYVTSIISRLRELDTTRQIAELKSKLQRVNPVEQVDEYNRLFGELLGLEQARRSLREQAIGDL